MAARRPEPCNSWCIHDKARGGACLYCGWTKEQREQRGQMAGTLRIYDVGTDEYRDATQADLDQLMAVAGSKAKIVAFIEQEDARLREELKTIRSKAGLPA